MANFNIFASEAIKASNMTVTENGHSATKTTGSAVLDLYGIAGALRGAHDERINDLFENAILDDKLLAAKTMFYTRDCRGGTGERNTFRIMLKYAAENYPDILEKNLHLIPFYGRWDDMYALVDTPLWGKAFEIIKGQLDIDREALKIENKPVSLLGKWLKSCNASSEETKKLGTLTRRMLGYSEKNYRKLLSDLRNRIDIVETLMSSGKWEDIQFDKVPSRAGMIYRNAFRTHNKDRYEEYIESVMTGEKKINTAMNTPQDLVHAYMEGDMDEDDPTIEAMWKNLPDFVNTDENILCMVDVSGSMTGRPMEVSTGLGMYFAQHNKGAFHNLFMTFDSNPSFMTISDYKSLRENLEDMLDAPWGRSTNLNLAFQEMLAFAKRRKVPNKDMPTRLIVISDMEIDEATTVWNSWKSPRMDTSLHADEVRALYEAAGYDMPQLIYWNVNSRDNHFHTRSDTAGTMLASGSSPAVFEAVLAMKDLDITPLDAMLEVLNGERYSPIRI